MVYVTPTSYLVLISSFKALLGKRRSAVAALQVTHSLYEPPTDPLMTPYYPLMTPYRPPNDPLLNPY